MLHPIRTECSQKLTRASRRGGCTRIHGQPVQPLGLDQDPPQGRFSRSPTTMPLASRVVAGGLGPMNIPILSDLTHQISKDYGVYDEAEGCDLRCVVIQSMRLYIPVYICCRSVRDASFQRHLHHRPQGHPPPPRLQRLPCGPQCGRSVPSGPGTSFSVHNLHDDDVLVRGFIAD